MFSIQLVVGGTPAKVDLNIAANGPARFLEALQERRETHLPFRIIGGEVHEYADVPHTLALLRPRRERPRGCGAEERDEVAPSHSITSSARASSVGGISRPSA